MGDKRTFTGTSKIKNIRRGEGHYTKRLASGDVSPKTKMRAAEEARAAAGGQLPSYLFKQARQGKLSR